jgi:hypothetical protein
LSSKNRKNRPAFKTDLYSGWLTSTPIMSYPNPLQWKELDTEVFEFINIVLKEYQAKISLKTSGR